MIFLLFFLPLCRVGLRCCFPYAKPEQIGSLISLRSREIKPQRASNWSVGNQRLLRDSWIARSLNCLARYCAIHLSSGPIAARGGGIKSSDNGLDLIGVKSASLWVMEHDCASCSLVLSIVEHWCESYSLVYPRLIGCNGGRRYEDGGDWFGG